MAVRLHDDAQLEESYQLRIEVRDANACDERSK
jgi:hypothetical protein